MNWYAVKTLYRTFTDGFVENPDEDFREDLDMLEERIVLLRADSFDDAIEQAEREAREYARVEQTNPYGQRICINYIEACDAYMLGEAPSESVEVFSSTSLINRETSDSEIMDMRLGAVSDDDERFSKKFLSQEFESEGNDDDIINTIDEEW
ncbi:DUF4288 domain-containing protein [Litoribrevibacter euphylliae]|uniref:DUF4288 domain-containing protein n=1 Tax=Litoribrevibacter euphylliae TaxID=1834034 RepID=A0ABV7HDJ6_9GAMM